MCSVCPGGDDGRVGSGSTAIRIEDLLSFPPLPVLAFSPRGKQPENGSLQILQILFQGDVLVKLGCGSTRWKRGFLLELWAWPGGLHAPG